jgi:hypothetical protein
MSSHSADSADQPTQGRRSLRDKKKPDSGRYGKRREATNLVDEMKRLSIRRDDTSPQKKVGSSDNPSSKGDVSAKASSSTSHAAARHATRPTAPRSQTASEAMKSKPLVKTVTSETRSTASSKKVLSPRAGGVQKVQGRARHESSQSPPRTPALTSNVLKCPVCQRPRGCKVKIVVHGENADTDSQEWALFLDRGGDSHENIISYIVGSPRQWRYVERRGVQPDPNKLLIVYEVGEIGPQDVAMYWELVMYEPENDETDPYQNSKAWCMESLENLRNCGLIAIDLELVDQDTEAHIDLRLAGAPSSSG